MNDAISEAPTSTAATAETEPEVIAAIASGEGQPYVPMPRRWRLDHPLALLVGCVALGCIVSRWMLRVR